MLLRQLRGKMGGTKRTIKKAVFILVLVLLTYLVAFHFHKEVESIEPLPGMLIICTFFLIERYIFTLTERDRLEETKMILFWNSYYEDKYYSMGTGYEGFKNCQHSNCFTTTHRSSLMDPDVIVHAVVFHIPQTELKDVQWLKSNRQEIRRYNQGIDPLFVFFSEEPPEGSLMNAEVFKDDIFQGFFNATISYRIASDVYRPYGAFIEKTTGKQPLNWKMPTSTQPKNRISLKSRTKDIAWVVSHCETVNLREKYAQKLKDLNLLNVDIFGSCGDHQLLSRQSVNETYNEGYAQLAEEYKFYLSFENSDCQDYVTEKFFNAFQHGLLPIALGGLDAKDYEKIAPPHSFLHIKNFTSPEDLMKYLVKLSQNEELYNSYFWWKDFYDLGFIESTCPLCQILNTKDFKSANDYSNIYEFWQAHQCAPPLNHPFMPKVKNFFYNARHSLHNLFSYLW